MVWRMVPLPPHPGGGTLALAATPAQAQKKYGPGVSDTEIKIGNTAPYSGPASAYAAAARSRNSPISRCSTSKAG